MAVEAELFQVPLAGGLEGEIQKNPANAGLLTNWRIDRQTGCWSTRLGYEPFEIGPFTSWSPFSNVGPVYGLHVGQGLGNGGRQHILYEHDGQLDLLYCAVGGTDLVRTLATRRSIPAPNEAGPWFTDTAYGTVVTNGRDRPVIVRPWPLGNASESASTISQCIRPFGFDSAPSPPSPHPVVPLVSPSLSSVATGGGATSLWCPSQPKAIAAGGLWGLGIARGNENGDESLYGWAVSYISDTGSEGPRSEIASTSWDLENGMSGYRYAASLQIPTGPTGTVARKVFRTDNYSDDGATPGDTTMYLVGLVRNNVDALFFDARGSADLGQPVPDVLTGPLPAPRARFSAMYAGCLFLDGGIDDPFALFFSAPGLIEQFAPAAVLSLASQGGGITGLFGHYNTLLVFRERGIDVVQGDYATGFQVATYSTSISCVSPHSIQAVPGLGVVFLARDGVYVFTGGFQGGSVGDLVLLSGGIDELIENLTADCLPQARAIYSAMWREYQLYIPYQGNDRPNIGLILHTDRLGAEESAWSIREGFPVGSLATLYDGTVLFGHNTGVQGLNNNAEQGLFVLSGLRTLGAAIVNDAYVAGAAPVSTYQSAWIDFGDPRLQKQVLSVTLWVMTTGTTPTITLSWLKDYGITPTAERTYQSQPPDAAALPVFDLALLDDGAVYSRERMVPIRFSVATMSCSVFAFRVSTQSDLLLYGWEIEYTSKGIATIHGRRA
jgi:hypothetical protein